MPRKPAAHAHVVSVHAAPEPVPDSTAAPTKTRAPARTLRVRVAEIGPHHLEAFDLVVAKDEKFAEQVRAALDAQADAITADCILDEAEVELERAKREHQTASDRAAELMPALTRLDAKAALVAKLHDDAPEAEDVEAGPTT